MKVLVPENWKQWKVLLDLLKCGEQTDDVIRAMKKGTLLWNTENSELLVQELSNVATFRMRIAINKFQKNLRRSYFRESKLISAVEDLRAELRLLTDATDIPVLPDQIREQFANDIRLQAEKIQSFMKTEANKDFTGRLLRLLNENSVTDY